MSKDLKVNGEWKGLWTAHVKVDGEWRPTYMDPKADGKYRSSYEYYLKESDIIGFRLVYQLENDARYPTLPNLRTNTKIPVNFGISGEDREMTFTEKGVVYNYGNDWWSGNDEEGIVSYKGTLYAILEDNIAISVSRGRPNEASDERLTSGLPDMLKGWDSHRVNRLNIEIKGSTFSEGERRLIGWNSLFTTEQNLEFDSPELMEPPRTILPRINRISTYDITSKIGIARSLTTVNDNMLGSWGHMSQSILWIKVDNVTKPFIVDIL